MRAVQAAALCALIAGATHSTAQPLDGADTAPPFDATEPLGSDADPPFAALGRVAGEPVTMMLRDFPRDAFSPEQLSDLHAHGLRDAAELIAAEAELVGRILGIGSLRAREFQMRLDAVMREPE